MEGQVAQTETWEDHTPYADLYLPRLRENDPTLTRLQYPGRCFDDANAARLGQALADNTHLTSLEFPNNRLTDEGFLQLLTGLERNSTVTKLDLENNSLGQRAASALLALLRQGNDTLVDVNLKVNRIGQDTLREVEFATRLNKQPQQWKCALVRLLPREEGAGDDQDPLRTLDLSLPPQTNPTLASLRPEPIVSVDGVQLLGDCLRTDCTVRVLNLCGNHLGDNRVQAVVEALLENDHLIELNLGSNSLTCETALALSEVLRRNHTLRELDLDDNGIGDMGTTALTECLRVNHTLADIRISRNNVSPRVSSLMVNSLLLNSQPPELRAMLPDIQLNSTKITKLRLNYQINQPPPSLDPKDSDDAGATPTIYITDTSCRVLYSALRHNTTVTHVDLSNNHIMDEGAKQLAKLLEENTTITTLLLNNNRIGAAGMESLMNTLEMNSTLTTLEAKGNVAASPEILSGLAVSVDLNSEPILLKKLAPKLQSDDPGLEVLDMSGESDRRCTQKSCRLMCTVLQPNTKLRRLVLSNNKDAGEEGVRMVCNLLLQGGCKGLQALELRNMGLGSGVVAPLAEMLGETDNLRELDLGGNPAIDTLAPMVTTLGTRNHTLTLLGIEGLPLHEAEVRDLDLLTRMNGQPGHFKDHILALFADASSLSELDLCEFESSGLSQYRYLKQYDDQAALLLGEALVVNTHLKTLNLSNNRVGDIGATALAESFAHNNSLTTLNLDNNLLGDEGGLAIARALLKNASITLVSVDRCNLTPETRQRIRQATQANTLREDTVYRADAGALGASATGVSSSERDYARMIDEQILIDALKDKEALLDPSTQRTLKDHFIQQ